VSNKIPFIAIEGPIGVGKTSLALLLSKYYDYQILNEIVYENPFLSKFYQDVDAWSFQTEMFFLTNRLKQLEDINKEFITKNKPVVADYHIFKNMIFAKQNLHGKKFEKFEKVYHILTEDLVKPNLVIVLNASLETLRKRILFRGREFELDMESEYLDHLITSYDEFYYNFPNLYPNTPILKFNGDEIDFVNKSEDLDNIIEQIDLILKG
jgi:deoxyguanosine kinase